MAAHVLRLRLALLLGSVRGDRRIRTLISLAAVIAVTAVVCIAVFSLAAAPVPVARAVTVLGGAARLIGFLGAVTSDYADTIMILQSIVTLAYQIVLGLFLIGATRALLDFIVQNQAKKSE